MFLILVPAAVFLISLLALGWWMYERQGVLGLVKLYLVLIGVVSGLLWFINRTTVDLGSTQFDSLLSLMPWGRVWVVDTSMLAALLAYTIKHHKTQPK